MFKRQTKKRLSYFVRQSSKRELEYDPNANTNTIHERKSNKLPLTKYVSYLIHHNLLKHSSTFIVQQKLRINKLMNKRSPLHTKYHEWLIDIDDNEFIHSYYQHETSLLKLRIILPIYSFLIRLFPQYNSFLDDQVYTIMSLLIWDKQNVIDTYLFNPSNIGMSSNAGNLMKSWSEIKAIELSKNQCEDWLYYNHANNNNNNPNIGDSIIEVEYFISYLNKCEWGEKVNMSHEMNAKHKEKSRRKGIWMKLWMEQFNNNNVKSIKEAVMVKRESMFALKITKDELLEKINSNKKKNSVILRGSFSAYKGRNIFNGIKGKEQNKSRNDVNMFSRQYVFAKTSIFVTKIKEKKRFNFSDKKQKYKYMKELINMKPPFITMESERTHDMFKKKYNIQGKRLMTLWTPDKDGKVGKAFMDSNQGLYVNTTTTISNEIAKTRRQCWSGPLAESTLVREIGNNILHMSKAQRMMNSFCTLSSLGNSGCTPRSNIIKCKCLKHRNKNTRALSVNNNKKLLVVS